MKIERKGDGIATRCLGACLLLLGGIGVRAEDATFLRMPPVGDRPLELEEVRNYWINSLPVPEEPRINTRGYVEAWRRYCDRLDRRRRLVEQISDGRFDAEAQRFALEHNREWSLRQGDRERAEALSRELEVLLRFREERRASEERQVLLSQLAKLEGEVERLRQELERLAKKPPVVEVKLTETPKPVPEAQVIERVVVTKDCHHPHPTHEGQGAKRVLSKEGGPSPLTQPFRAGTR